MAQSAISNHVLCLSQSALSNFAPHVIIHDNDNHNHNDFISPGWVITFNIVVSLTAL